MAVNQPAYVTAYENGRLQEKAHAASARLQDCTLCPRRCHSDRLNGISGFCKTADRALVSSFCAHFGEETPLVGTHGSGTIFFTHCNLLCNFCQNYDISHGGQGHPLEDRQLARMMLKLQQEGCHNINLVTPTHVVPQILKALEIATGEGLCIPLVYNCGGYERVETLRLLEGIVDIYMPDFKFWDADVAQETCQAEDYPQVARRAVLEMFRQVGDLEINSDGLAVRGLLVRHLVLPHGMAGTEEIMRFIARNISKHTYVNIMPQYRPCGTVHKISKLCRPVTTTEFENALKSAMDQGLSRLDPIMRTFVLR